MEKLIINQGKNKVVNSPLGLFHCFAIKTKVITQKDDITSIINMYARPHLESGDILFLSEKMVSCTQGRAIPIASIRPGFFATNLSKFVTKSNRGIGLAMPETMQCAIDEVGLPRILLAAAVGAFGKLLKQKGWFYHVAGRKAAGIDGPAHYNLPPYNKYVVLTPQSSNQVAAEIAENLMSVPTENHSEESTGESAENIKNITVLIVDVCDYGAEILGSSRNLDRNDYAELLRQNPLGQSNESTPIGILRKQRNEKWRVKYID